MPVTATMSKKNESPVIRRITTKSGRVIFATDEHPILTVADSWKCARDLHIGDELFQYSEHESQSVTSKPLNVPYHHPSLFDHELVPYDEVRLSRVPLLAVDFDGNTVPRKREIADVPTKNELMDEVGISDVFHSVKKRALALAANTLDMFNSSSVNFADDVLGERGIIDTHTPSSVRAFYPIGPVQFPFVQRTKRRDRSKIPYLHSAVSQSVSNNLSTYAKLSTNLFKRLGFVLFDDPRFVKVDPRPHDVAPECWSSDPIVSITLVECQKRVYNLAVEMDESYLANGIVAHNCRTTLVPILRSWRELGVRSPRVRREAPPGTQSSLNGQVSAELNYDQWLRKQPKSVQIEALGRTKRDLWARGEIKNLSELTDQTGRSLTLVELRARSGLPLVSPTSIDVPPVIPPSVIPPPIPAQQRV